MAEAIDRNSIHRNSTHRFTDSCIRLSAFPNLRDKRHHARSVCPFDELCLRGVGGYGRGYIRKPINKIYDDNADRIDTRKVSAFRRRRVSFFGALKLSEERKR